MPLGEGHSDQSVELFSNSITVVDLTTLIADHKADEPPVLFRRCDKPVARVNRKAQKRLLKHITFLRL